MFSLEKASDNLNGAFRYLKEAYKKNGERLLQEHRVKGQTGMVSNFNKNRFRLDMRKESFTVRMLRHWDNLPMEVVDTRSLEVFMVSLAEL